MDSSIKVSIVCLAYNHEKYIRQTLDGFLMQKVNFNYEILIHDDASTDNTADIIREYQSKFPNIVKPIFQTENQHSKRVKISHTFVYPKARGKYIALCEGDDFWIDEDKLQKQVDFLENNPKYSCCTHAYNLLDMRVNETKPVFSFPCSKTVTTEEAIEGDGSLFATNSIVAHADLVTNPPDFRKNFCVGDYPLIIHMAFAGKIYYMNEVMSTYRYMVPGSWTHRNIGTDIEKLRKHTERIISDINEADRYSEFKFHKSFEKVIEKKRYFYDKNVLSPVALMKRYPLLFKSTLKDKVYRFINRHFPFVLKLAKIFKRN